MINLYKKKLYLAIILILFSVIIAPKTIAFTNINVVVEGCNNNNICEAPSENNLLCSNDCTTCNSNSVCEILKGESHNSCPSDCVAITTTGHRRIATSTAYIPEKVIGQIQNLKIKVGINYVVISWDTEVPTYGSINWGKGDSYNDGVVNSLKISNHQELIIDNLSAATAYSYVINANLPEVDYAILTGNFTTLPIPTIKIIPLVTNFSATTTADEIILNWNNPENKDFAGVKIVRSPFFYPQSPDDGKIIYDGNGTYARDSEFEFDTNYYYSAFSYDKDLNFSPSAVLNITFKSIPIIIENIDNQLTQSRLNILPINNFIFAQSDWELALSSTTLKTYPLNDLKIIIDKNRLPEAIKTIIIKIQDLYDKTKISSYSFKFDSINNYFYVVIPNSEIKLSKLFIILSYSLDNKIVSISEGTFEVGLIRDPQISQSLSSQFNKMSYVYIGIFAFIILSIFLFDSKRKTYSK